MQDQNSLSGRDGELVRYIPRCLIIAVVALGIATSPVRAQDADPVLLVAKRRLANPLFRHTVLIAKSIGNRQHIGFILNKATEIGLRQKGEAVRVPPEPLYLGGPFQLNSIFALVKQDERPGPGAFQITDGLFVVMQKEVLRRIVESGASDKRFFVGTVVWKPGELAAELNQGMWCTAKPDIETVMSLSSTELWEKLVSQCEEREHFLEDGI